MNSEQYQSLVNQALHQYINRPEFLGYVYPGQFYDYTKNRAEFEAITHNNSYRWMVSLSDACDTFKGVQFSKLSPARTGDRSHKKTLNAIFDAATDWVKTHQKTNIVVHIAKATNNDRNATLNDISRYFGGKANLVYIVTHTRLSMEDLPLLNRADYKSLFSKMADEKLNTLNEVNMAISSQLAA